MRILFVNTFYYPNMPGGAEQSVKLLAEGLVRRGHTVAVFTGDLKDGEFSLEEHGGVQVYRYNTGKFNLYKFSYDKGNVGKVEKIQQKLLTYFNKHSEKKFVEVCKQFKPDVIHTNTLYGIPARIWKSAKKMGIPTVHTIRDTAIISAFQYGHKTNPVVEAIHRFYNNYYSKYVTAVTAPSDYTLSTSLAIGSFANVKTKKRIFNSVPVDEQTLNACIEDRLARNDGHIKFMYAGRLAAFKGIKPMVEAFTKMHFNNASLHICGTGALLDYVKECASQDDRIKCYGHLDNAAVDEVYRSCDVLIVPSDWPEPFGRIVIEGNRYGMPVIATECGGIPEIMDTVGGGKSYDSKDVDALARLMDEFSDRTVHPQYMQAIKENIAVFDIEKQVSEFLNIYTSISEN